MQGTVTEQGLTLADGRRLGWDDVYHVDWTEKEAVIATAVGMVRTTRADGRRAEAKIAPWEAQRDAAMDAADERTIAQWTGAPPGRVHVQPFKVGRVWVILGRVAASLVAIGLGVGTLLFGRHGVDSVLVLALSVSLLMLHLLWPQLYARLTRTPTDIQLDARRIPWRDIRRAYVSFQQDQGSATLQLHTRHGRVELAPGYQGWAEACDQISAAATYRTGAAAADLSRGVFAPDLLSTYRGLWLDGRGLTVINRNSVKQYPLSSLDAPEWTTSGPVIRADGKDVGTLMKLDSGLLAQELERRLGIERQEIATAAGDLRPEMIERWLGVAPGGVLHCRKHSSAIVGTLLVVGLCCGVAYLVAVRDGIDAFSIVSAIAVLALLLIMPANILTSARRIDADAQGLTVRRGRQRARYAWADLTDIKSSSFETIITTARGDVIRLSDFSSGSKRVRGLVRRLLSVKDTGVSLPSTAPIPDTALTVTPARPATADAGLSVAPAPQRLRPDETQTTVDVERTD
ncbi:MAG TPA: hypothetical protein DCZ72_00330 [Armatimonadetes bacterium]|mgnify:CR=1 FL=1|nr:hypothetical protein [Armatimonadota bacterium]